MDQTISIIIEWENVILSDNDRATEMLSELSSQIDAALQSRRLHSFMEQADNSTIVEGKVFEDQPVQSPLEILVFGDPNEVDLDIAKALLRERLTLISNQVFISIIKAPGRHYYDIKNYGANLARGYYLLFVDSDVIPDENWFQNYIDVLEKNPSINVLGGNAYIDPIDVYHKTFALTWFFDLRQDDNSIYQIQEFKANNFIVKRSTLLEYPFPINTHLYRGQCAMLCSVLANNHIRVYRTNGSQVSHPAPNGLKHFFERALCQGHDSVQARIFRKRSRFSVKTYLRPLRRMLSSAKQLVLHHKKVQLSVFSLPYAISIAGLYQLTVIMGITIASINPRFIRRNFQV